MKTIPSSLGQYFIYNKTSKIRIDGKILPYDYNSTNLNRLTGESDRVGREGYCYLNNGSYTMTLPLTSSPSGTVIVYSDTSTDGITWTKDNVITSIYSERVLNFSSGTYYKNIRVYQNNDTNDLYDQYHCEEENGTTAYGIKGNNATLSNANIHSQQDGVLYSDSFNRGYTLDGTVVVPLLEDLSSDAAGNPIQYIGRYKPYLQVVDSPAASVANNATLIFDNTTPYTLPNSVSIHAGTAAGSYDSGTGVFTIGASGSGTIEALTINGTVVYLSHNQATRCVFKIGSSRFSFVFSAVTWGTTNNNAFNQSRGANIYGIVVDEDFASGLGVFNNATPTTSTRTYAHEITSIGGRTGTLKLSINNATITDSIAANLLVPYSQLIGLITSGDSIMSGLRAKIKFDVYRPSVNGLVTKNFLTYFGSGNVVGFPAITADDTWETKEVEANWNKNTNLFQIGFFFSVTPGANTDGDALYFDNFSVEVLTPIPSAIDPDGNSTGLDVFGTPIPDPHLSGRGLRKSLDNFLNVNPENLPTLNQMGYSANSTDNIISINALRELFGAFKGRKETDELVNYLTLFDRGEQPCLTLNGIDNYVDLDTNPLQLAVGQKLSVYVFGYLASGDQYLFANSTNANNYIYLNSNNVILRILSGEAATTFSFNSIPTTFYLEVDFIDSSTCSVTVSDLDTGESNTVIESISTASLSFNRIGSNGSNSNLFSGSLSGVEIKQNVEIQQATPFNEGVGTVVNEVVNQTTGTIVGTTTNLWTLTQKVYDYGGAYGTNKYPDIIDVAHIISGGGTTNFDLGATLTIKSVFTPVWGFNSYSKASAQQYLFVGRPNFGGGFWVRFILGTNNIIVEVYERPTATVLSDSGSATINYTIEEEVTVYFKRIAGGNYEVYVNQYVTPDITITPVNTSTVNSFLTRASFLSPFNTENYANNLTPKEFVAWNFDVNPTTEPVTTALYAYTDVVNSNTNLGTAGSSFDIVTKAFKDGYLPAKLPLDGTDVLGNTLSTTEIERVLDQQQGLKLIKK